MFSPKNLHKLLTYCPGVLAVAALLSPLSACADADPTGGNFTLEEALKGISGTDKLNAVIKTSQGDFRCELFEKDAPVTVANFVGLARGVRPFLDPASDQWIKRSFYDGLTFHRVIPGFMIQGGDIKGDGSGEPGYTIKDEKNGTHKFDHGGVLAMANRGPNTAGSQFFITEDASSALDDGARPGSHYQIFGDCSPVDLVRKIARLPRDDRDKPRTEIKILTVTVQRGEVAATARLKQYLGKVTLAASWAIIAPRTSSGDTWDGTPARNPLVEEEARKPVERIVTRRLFQEMSRGSDPMPWLIKRLPWTGDGFVSGMHAPDVELEFGVEDQVLGRGEKVEDNYAPHWDGKPSAAVDLSPQSVVKVKVIDADVIAKQEIGTCEIIGIPWVDDNGFVVPGSYRCSSQVWALGIRVTPIDVSVPVSYRKSEAARPTAPPPAAP